VRKWTKSACVLVAWCILATPAAVGSRGPDRPAQANISIASSTQAFLRTPETILTQRTTTWKVRPGGTAPTASKGGAAPAGVMPWWLKDILLAAGLLVVIAFLTEPLALLAGRRRRAIRTAGVAKKAQIVLADHERLIVTYSMRDHTVYVLTPPGEDPQAVLRAARLVLPERAYEDLAGHLGVPSAWPLE
jgi:hypothetical protein